MSDGDIGQEALLAAEVLVQFARTAPGRLPHRVQHAIAVIEGLSVTHQVLPPLPEPSRPGEYGDPNPLYTAEQMRKYALSCVAAEREACAQLCEFWDATHPARIAQAIRERR